MFQLNFSAGIFFRSVLIILSISINSSAQTLEQVVRGRVVDKITQQAIYGASLSLDSNLFLGTMTDSLGFFQFKIPLGRHYLKVSHIVYNSLSLPILVNSGKEVAVTVKMSENVENLNEVIVTANQYEEEQIPQIGKINFTVDEGQRNAAIFSDPARLVSQYPGIFVVNDQANNISVHGNSPNTISWKLEGIEIVNPNHLINAGTFNDRITQSGGGINILSSQLMTNSSFLMGPFPAEYGNTLSGIFDINFRKGNNKKQEYTAQASLYGIDFALEGPFSKRSESSYLINYRYSTVALFNLMGIKFGSEDIRFQDLSLNLFFPTKNAGIFTIFGMGGLSSNKFITPRDSSLWSLQKDHYDIIFHSNMFALGTTHEVNLGRKTFLKSVVAVSELQSSREGIFIDNQYVSTLKEEDKLQHRKTSFTTSVFHKLNLKNAFKAGIYFSQLDFDMLTNENLLANPTATISGKGSYELIQPYINYEHKFSKTLILNFGLHVMYFTLNKSKSVEPRIDLNWLFKKNQSVGLAYGLHSMLQQPQVYFMLLPDGDSKSNLNSNLDFTKSHHFALMYNRKIVKELKLIIQFYYQYLFNIPIEDNSSSSFSAINVLDDWVSKPLVNKGSGENYGMDVSIEKFLDSKYYFLVSSSLYTSVYKAGDGIRRSTRFNGNYTMAITLGKEIVSMKNEKNRTIGTNIKLVYLGGYRSTPIDPTMSSLLNTTYFIQNQAFSTKMPDFYRIDFRFSIKKNKTNYTRTWAIDIQNITNHLNLAYQYYDPYQKKIINKYQLGFIPILSYRVDF